MGWVIFIFKIMVYKEHIVLINWAKDIIFIIAIMKHIFETEWHILCLVFTCIAFSLNFTTWKIIYYHTYFSHIETVSENLTVTLTGHGFTSGWFSLWMTKSKGWAEVTKKVMWRVTSGRHFHFSVASQIVGDRVNWGTSYFSPVSVVRQMLLCPLSSVAPGSILWEIFPHFPLLLYYLIACMCNSKY